MTREDRLLHNKRMTDRTGLPHLYWDKARQSWCVRLPGPLPGRLPEPWGIGRQRLVARVVDLNADLDALPYMARRTRSSA